MNSVGQQEPYTISSDDSDTESKSNGLGCMKRKLEADVSMEDDTPEGKLLRSSRIYQDHMSRLPVPRQGASVIPYLSWQALGKSMKQKYEQPLHYLTNILLKQWDQLRVEPHDEWQPLDAIIHPSKAEALIWLTEEMHRLTTSHHHLAKLWASDTMYYTFVDSDIPKL